MRDDGLGLDDDAFAAAPSLESLRDAGSSASIRDLDLPDLEADLGARVADELETALMGDDDGKTVSRLDRTVREEEIREEEIPADLIGPEQTAPGVWRTASPVEDDNEITASRQSRRAGRGIVEGRGRNAPELLPDPDELDGLFVDLVDEAEPER